MADVAAHLHAVKAYGPGYFIRAALRRLHVVAECRDAQHAAAGRNDPVAVERGAGMKHVVIITRADPDLPLTHPEERRQR